MQSPDGRPIYLDLRKIRLPMPGIISIMHRVFGALLSISIPFFAYLFTLSLQDQAGFEEARNILTSNLLVPVFLVLIWGFVHHLLAGIRYLLIDIEVGVERKVSYNSSLVVFYAAIVVTLLIVWRIWL